MFRKGGKAEKRLKRLRWRFGVPAYADNRGIRLPLRHPAITSPIQKDIFFGSYEGKEAELVQLKIERHDIVMEVGAGIGFLSALCARIVGSDKVFAYEANPQLLEVIHQVHSMNGVAPTVTNALLGDGTGECEFFLEKDFWASSLIRGSAEAEAIRVPKLDRNTEIRRIAPTFLIVDIEGGEYEFFSGIDLGSVRKICIETHPHLLGNRRVSEILGWLFTAGFSLDFSCMRKNVYFLYRDHAA
jgi:FkbM family methyltransferase